MRGLSICCLSLEPLRPHHCCSACLGQRGKAGWRGSCTLLEQGLGARLPKGRGCPERQVGHFQKGLGRLDPCIQGSPGERQQLSASLLIQAIPSAAEV